MQPFHHREGEKAADRPCPGWGLRAQLRDRSHDGSIRSENLALRQRQSRRKDVLAVLAGRRAAEFEAWLEKTSASPFNVWLNAKVRNADGSLDLDRLYETARAYGIKNEYRHLNPGQQRMNVGMQLRKKVPESEGCLAARASR